MTTPRGASGALTALVGLLLLLPSPAEAQFPRPGRTPHDRAIRDRVGEEELKVCQYTEHSARIVREIPSMAVPATFTVGRGYRRIEPEATTRALYLEGRYGQVWEFRPDFGLRAIETWYDPRDEDGILYEYLIQFDQMDSYIRFAPGESWSLTDMSECGAYAWGRPVRALRFTAVRDDGMTLYAVAAYWRTMNGARWVSILGLGTAPHAQDEFLTIISQSR